MGTVIKIGVSLLIACSFNFTHCNESLAIDIPTTKEYEEHLEKQVDAESLQIKVYFSKLSLEKKRKFMKYYFDPKIVKNIYSQEIDPNSKKLLYDGNVVIESKSTTSERAIANDIPPSQTPIESLLSSILFNNVFAAPVIKEYTVTDVKNVKILGGNIKHTVSILYRVINGKVKKIITGYATVEKNLCPNNIQRLSFSKYITAPNNLAHGASIWEMSLPILKNKLFDISPITVIKHHAVHGYSNGKVTWSFWT